jgi:transposase-like protein
MSAKSNKQDKGRFSSQLKQAAVLRRLRGDDLDTLSRELGVTAAPMSAPRCESLRQERPSKPLDD